MILWENVILRGGTWIDEGMKCHDVCNLISNGSSKKKKATYGEMLIVVDSKRGEYMGSLY